MENKALRIVFPVFLGVLLALLIGFGLQAVYPQPESPSPGYEAPYEAYLASLQAYERIAAAVLSGLAVVLLAAGSLLPARAAALAEGLLLGGVFTLIYAAARGSGAGPGLPAAPAVGAVGVGLVLALAALFLRQSGRLPRRRERRAETADETALAVVFPLAAAPSRQPSSRSASRPSIRLRCCRATAARATRTSSPSTRGTPGSSARPRQRS
ncbi:hypothetical protein [Sinomonas atrocyanea]